MAKEKKQSFELNIYRLANSLSLEEYGAIFKQKKENCKHYSIIDDEEYSLLYYTYTNFTEADEIDWFKKWRLFFKEINEPLRKNSQSGHGVIVIELKEKNEKYALVFGRAFTLIKDYIISQFGMDMASILFDGKSIDSISSKFFSLNKNKSITSYYGDSTFEFADNEAVDLLKANIVDYFVEDTTALVDLLKTVKRKATIGMDNLKLSIYKEEILLTDLIEVCKNVDEIRIKYEPRFPFPKMTPVKKTIAEELDAKLLSDIMCNDITNFEFSVPFYSKASSDEFEFLNNINEIKVKIGRNESPVYDSVDSTQIFTFLKEHKEEVTNIRNVKIIIDDESDFLIKWIDVQIDYKGKTYALYDAKWFEFNQAYIDNIKKKIQSFEQDVIVVDNLGEYNFGKQEISEYMSDNRDSVIESFGSDEPYREYIYNYKIAEEKGYHLFDRVTFRGNIEVCDLYGNNSLTHCKIGTTANLEECLRQSIYGTKYYFQQRDEVREKQNKKGETIGNVDSACVIFLSYSNIENFLISNRRSLRVQQTFIDWYNMCRQMNYTPKLIVSKYVK